MAGTQLPPQLLESMEEQRVNNSLVLNKDDDLDDSKKKGHEDDDDHERDRHLLDNSTSIMAHRLTGEPMLHSIPFQFLFFHLPTSIPYSYCLFCIKFRGLINFG